MSKQRLLLLAVLFAMTALVSQLNRAVAEGLPANSDLIEVTAANKPKCVEYYIIQGKSFCSTKPLTQGPGALSQGEIERLRLQFDGRPWVSAWGKNSPSIVTVEYVVAGDDINNWKELVTSQFLPGLQGRPSPQQYAANVITHLKTQVPAVQAATLVNAPNEVLFEFKVGQPAEMAQHELQRAFWGKDGMYIVHYVIKQPEMGAARRAQWIELLKNATPKG